METTTEDEVVKEFDVYLSKSLSGRLYLLQYPVQSVKRKYGSQDRDTAKIKPQNNKIEMDVSLDISSPNYDQSKGEQIALNVDGNVGTIQASTTFDTNVMDRQTLQSSCVPARGKRYVSAIVQHDEVHLTPISHVMQLKPSFKYMDRAEHRASQAAKAKAAAEADSSQDEAEEAKAVTVRVKGAESEAVRLARERSYAAYEKRIADEKWIEVKVHHKLDSYAERERQRLICQNTRQPDDKLSPALTAFSEMVQTPHEYLTKLIPVYDEHSVDNSAIPDNVLSLSLLKNETLGDQLKLLMKNAKILHFYHLISLLPEPPDVSIIVRSLQSYAVLVKGCWVVKSEVLFPANTLSPISGTPSESLCKSRDYILYMFTRKEFLVRKEITNTVKLPGDDVKAILEDIAVMRMGHGWQLRLRPDNDFMNRFPDVCERQTMLWNAQGAKLAKQLNLTELVGDLNSVHIKQEISSPPRRKKNASSSEDGVSNKKKTVSKRQRKSSGHKTSPARSHQAPNESPKVKSVPMSPNSKRTSIQEMPKSVASVKKLDPSQNSSNLTCVNTICEQPFHGLDGAAALVNSAVPIAMGDIGKLSPKINIAGVNSTVQSVATEMIKRGSPQQKVQYFIPQMNISSPTYDAALECTNGQSAAMEVNEEQSINNISNINIDHVS
ncbi:DNA-directed RNA polymerase III subunit RPC5-like [Styela clava]